MHIYFRRSAGQSRTIPPLEQLQQTITRRLRVSSAEHRDWIEARRPVLLGHIPMEFSSCVYRLK
ncbi:hypothetical protein HETIRDRAFT_422752 [Heterobasidion irregulare TC 32-1]|uniref:Uncharacterized protein n=1 Tax=Heterobasidion irregulare (strain TC 32-1) TaxID=747525 RepID=W4JSU7_HETIT|nr:uncharacterized protein HETIRDRAFT_422752 [Heterobasidion irregulare TC 32-1]ETW76180.1 hypothetical protein HETIRDRAFT_422752 [Heterobasidion irregulare TC 32-1]